MDILSRFGSRVIELLAIGLMLAGIVLVLHSLGLLLWQYVGLIESRSWTPLPMRLWFVDQAMLHGTAVAGALPFIPELQWPWIANLQGWPSWILDRIHIGVIPAACGALIAMLGNLAWRKQRSAFTLARQRTEDRLRRRREYRRQATA